MNKLKHIAATIAFVLVSILADAQDIANNNEGIMKSNGKIYVVMLVVIVIVAGLFLYLLNLDKKISKLEKE
jgi:CcmD family protein